MQGIEYDAAKGYNSQTGMLPCEPSVNALRFNPSHSNGLRISRKLPECEGVNSFFQK